MRLQTLALPALSLFLFLAVWEGAARLDLVRPHVLPAPTRVLEEGGKMWRRGWLLEDVIVSTRRVLAGFALSSLAAVPLGLLLGVSPLLRAAAAPVISLLRPLPSMSWIPLSMIWLGIGEGQKVAIVFMGSFATVLVYCIDATLRVEEDLILAARNLGASQARILREVIFPGALPHILSGLKVALAVAWTCIIAAEMVGASQGLGFRIWQAKDFNNTPQVLVGMGGISVTVLFLDLIFQRVEKALTPWLSPR